MRERRDQSPGYVARHDRIGIQRADVLDLTQSFRVACLHTKGGFCSPSQQEIQLVQFAAFALPAHPALFLWIPLGVTMEKVEGARRFAVILSVQRMNAG